MLNASPNTRPANDLARDLGAALLAREWRLVVAESCTGGGLGWVVTSVPGSSGWFDRGFVTYTNAAKHELLGVGQDVLARHGAVSAVTVRAMAKGALARSPARLAIAISGIAGPGGATPGKPVGTVWIAWAVADGTENERCWHFAGDRHAVRRQAITQALSGALALVTAQGGA